MLVVGNTLPENTMLSTVEVVRNVVVVSVKDVGAVPPAQLAPLVQSVSEALVHV